MISTIDLLNTITGSVNHFQGVGFTKGNRCDSPGCDSLCVSSEFGRGYCGGHHSGRADNLAHWIFDLGISLGLDVEFCEPYYSHLCRIGVRDNHPGVMIP